VNDRLDNPILEASELLFVYPDGTRALQGLSLSVDAGERVALVGPNGSGKTTFLLHLNGLLLPGGGRLTLAGKDLSRACVAHARASVGLLFQDPDDQLFMPTVLEDVSFGPLNLGLSREEASARAREALASVGLEGVEGKPPQFLSSGQKRLAALAGLLSMKPRLLALDEPTSGLDPRARRTLERKLKELDTTLLVASHDLEFCLTVCDRAVVLEEGRVEGEGPVCEVFADRAFMESHGLERPHSLDHMEGIHRHEGAG